MPSFDTLVDQYIWSVTLISALVSLGIFLVLVIFRFFYDRIKDQRILRKKKLQQQLLIHLANPLRDLKGALLKDRMDMELVAEIAPSLLRTLKGSSYQRLLDSLESIGLYEWALKKLHSKNRPQKISAINLIAHWPNKRVKQKLKTLLKDKHSLVQYAAMEALAQTQDEKMLPAIIKEFKKQKSFSNLLMADIFQKFGSAISAKLSDYLKAKNTPVHIKIPAMISLTRMENANLFYNTALNLCEHKDSELRAMAYYALSESGEPIDKGLLEKGMRDADWRVRQYTASCAVYARPLPAEILIELLQDKNWLVGLRAGQAMCSAGLAGITLLKTLANQDSVPGNRARMILAEQLQRGDAHGMA